jgi:RHS repeat-associated protein
MASRVDRIARHDSSNNVYYYATDHLGTSRIIAEVPSGSTAAALCYDADFYPFGGERAYTTSCSQHYKFTGKERDSESCAAGTCLDNSAARFSASSLGRFMSPDPDNAGANLASPQSWNMYSYVLNNPLVITDPLGLDCVYLDDSGGTSPNGPGGASIDHDSDQGQCNESGGYWANGNIASLKDVQTFSANDNALIFSDEGGITNVSLANQSETQGGFGLGNIPASFWRGQFADPSDLSGPTLQDQQINALMNGARMAGRALPTVCGGGVFGYAGGGNAYGLVEYDSRSGLSAGGILEGGKNKGGGFIGTSTKTRLEGSPFIFVGEGVGALTTISKTPSIGGFAGGDIPGTNLAAGGGVYVNVTDAWDCN